MPNYKSFAKKNYKKSHRLYKAPKSDCADNNNSPIPEINDTITLPAPIGENLWNLNNSYIKVKVITNSADPTNDDNLKRINDAVKNHLMNNMGLLVNGTQIA